MKDFFLLLSIVCLFFLHSGVSLAEPVSEVPGDARCPVCGMFVANYDSWICQITLESGEVVFFDGVKDMMAYYFTPSHYGAASKVKDILVRDYYSQEMIEAKSAFYVLGSDVLGPMGHELIPFSSRAAAENFMKDHKGREILVFSEITSAKVDQMRTGKGSHTMHKMQQNH